jgi:antitoxin ParD1/3/4
MANVTKISVALTPEMNALVQQAVASGEYATSSEVIREALRAWHQQRSLSRDDRVELRKLWSDGVDSGPATLDSMAATKIEARRRRADGSVSPGPWPHAPARNAPRTI